MQVFLLLLLFIPQIALASSSSSSRFFPSSSSSSIGDKEVVAIYQGCFFPPTVGHFKVMATAAKKFGIKEALLFVKERETAKYKWRTQAAREGWRKYIPLLQKKYGITVRLALRGKHLEAVSPTAALKHVYVNHYRKHPNRANIRYLFFAGSDHKDYPRVIHAKIPFKFAVVDREQEGISSTKLRECLAATKVKDLEACFKFLPPDLPEDEKTAMLTKWKTLLRGRTKK